MQLSTIYVYDSVRFHADREVPTDSVLSLGDVYTADQLTTMYRGSSEFFITRRPSQIPGMSQRPCVMCIKSPRIIKDIVTTMLDEGFERGRLTLDPASDKYAIIGSFTTDNHTCNETPIYLERVLDGEEIPVTPKSQ